MHLVGFSIEIYKDARPYELQIFPVKFVIVNKMHDVSVCARVRRTLKPILTH